MSNSIVPLLQFAIYFIVSFIVTYILYRKGWFNNVKKTFHNFLIILGILLPIVDSYQTLRALELGKEGNPIFNFTPLDFQLSFVIITHIAMIMISIFFGWKGYSEENVLFRASLSFFVTALVITTFVNALALLVYSF